jgi:hypothetical protein
MNVKSSTSEMVKVVNLLRSFVDDPTFFGLVRKLNVEQRLFYNHILFCVLRFAEQQLKSFLTGGAGMGKSVLTSALFQGLTRWYNDQPEMDKSSIKVLVLAPTGAAAFEVSGMTIHSGLGNPAQQSIHEYRLLNTSRLNEMRSSFKDLRWIIIDEISLVGKTMVAFVD